VGCGTAKDCDDNNPNDGPGMGWVSTGCPAGQVKQCHANGDGAYGPCTAYASITCPYGSGTKAWFKQSGSTSAGCGAYGSECDVSCITNTSLACYVARYNCFFIKHGTYTTVVSTPDDGVAHWIGVFS